MDEQDDMQGWAYQQEIEHKQWVDEQKEEKRYE